MKTNSKEVKITVNNHIDDFIDYTEYENCSSVKEALKSQIDYMKYNNESEYQAAYRMAEGGYFLIATYDINEFIKSLNLNNNSNKIYNDIETFNLYCHLIATQIVSIIK